MLVVEVSQETALESAELLKQWCWIVRPFNSDRGETVSSLLIHIIFKCMLLCVTCQVTCTIGGIMMIALGMVFRERK